MRVCDQRRLDVVGRAQANSGRVKYLVHRTLRDELLPRDLCEGQPGGVSRQEARLNLGQEASDLCSSTNRPELSRVRPFLTSSMNTKASSAFWRLILRYGSMSRRIRSAGRAPLIAKYHASLGL